MGSSYLHAIILFAIIKYLIKNLGDEFVYLQENSDSALHPEAGITLILQFIRKETLKK